MGRLHPYAMSSTGRCRGTGIGPKPSAWSPVTHYSGPRGSEGKQEGLWSSSMLKEV